MVVLETDTKGLALTNIHSSIINRPNNEYPQRPSCQLISTDCKYAQAVEV